MTFDFIIILSAAAQNINGDFPDFMNGMYLGGQVRINAAKELLGQYPNTQFIVVGGYNEKNIGIAGTSKKVDDIFAFLKHASPESKILRVYSLPCTHHNFVAIFNHWQRNKIHPQKVGIVSNEYHLPRAMLFAEEINRKMSPDNPIAFVPIAAEKVDGTISPQFEDHESLAAIAKRFEHEKSGIEKFKEGDYRDYCLTRDFPALQAFIYENAKELLDIEEKLALKIT